jgi:hypothetical protein
VAIKWIEVIRYGALLVLFLLVYLLLLKPVMNTVSAVLQAGEIRIASGAGAVALAAREVPGQLPEPATSDALLSSAGQPGLEMERALALKQAIVKNVQTAPQDAGRLVQNWIRGA